MPRSAWDETMPYDACDSEPSEPEPTETRLAAERARVETHPIFGDGSSEDSDAEAWSLWVD
jgi:hypothetical protein